MTLAAWRVPVALALMALYPDLALAEVYAVVVGNNAVPANHAEGTLLPLKYADDDAVRFFQFFERSGAKVTLLSVLDQATQRRYPEVAAHARPPELRVLNQVLEVVAQKIDAAPGEESVFFFVYSGHGARDGSGRVSLAFLDGGLDQQRLYEQVLAAIPARYTHVLIDACNAGAVVGVRGVFDRETDATMVTIEPEEVAPPIQADYPSVGLIVATTDGQQSHEWSRLESGVFTHEVLSAFSGAADVNRDGFVEYSELHAFVSSANRDLKDPRARPNLIIRPPSINARAPLADLRKLRAGFLTGTPGSIGAFYVELENGQRYLDAHLEPAIDARIAVPAGMVAFVRTRNSEAQLRLEVSKELALSDLAFEPLGERERGSIAETYQRDLFASPYGVEYYRGFVDRTGGGGVTLTHDPSLHARQVPARTPAYAWWGAAGGLAATSVVTGVLARKARKDFNATTLQRTSRRAASRFRRNAAFAGTSAVLSVAAATTGWFLWPTPEVSSPESGTMGVSYRRSW